MKRTMNFADNVTRELWQRFMPRRHELRNEQQSDLYSVQIYPRDMVFSDVTRDFEKWAAIAVSESHDIPDGMEALVIPQGEYAVFLHVGLPSGAADTFRYIFNDWLPNSGFELDDRPHFEVLGEKYSNFADDSEEEVWIPIR